MAALNEGTSIEWFGTTTFRLKTKGLTIFLDTYLERPSVLPRYLSIDDVEEADYICISHAHFDHLPGADRLALRTGAVVIANGEAINILRRAGVPSEQLIPVGGGERVPLYTRSTRIKATKGEIDTAPGPASAPRVPHPRFVVTSIHVWPSLHGLIPGSYPNLPDVLDTGFVYEGKAHPYTCTLDITRGMEHGLLKMEYWLSPEKRSPGQQSFIDYIKDTEHDLYSHFDGGQLMFNILVEGSKAVLWNAHLGAYEGIMKALEPKPDVLIMGVAGRANHNGRPYDGSAAEYVTNVRWLDELKTVIWCLHDE